MIEYKAGDRVRIIPFCAIIPNPYLHPGDCFGINEETIDHYATRNEYYTVEKRSGSAAGNLYKLNGIEGYWWHQSMLRLYEEDKEDGFGAAEDPERIFTSLFGTDIEVWR